MRHTRRKLLVSLGTAMTIPLLAGLTRAGQTALGLGDSAKFLREVTAGNLAGAQSMLGADPTLASAADGHGRSAFVLAHIHGHQAVGDVLRDAGIELDLIEAVLAQDWVRFKTICAEQPELRGESHPVGGTAIYAAALVGSRSFWRLRDEGIPPNIAPAGGSG